MSSEKNLHHFCFWHPPSYDFYIVILSSGINEFFLPDGLKKKINPAGQPSDYSFWNIFFSSSSCCYFIAIPCCAFDYKTPMPFR